LTFGAFPEIELRAKQIGWKGKADLLVTSPNGCEIIDFKTGEYDDWHRFQIQVYALLWNRDVDLNPNKRLAERLVLTYSTGDVEIPALHESQLDYLERELVSRREAAHQAISERPPQAKPDVKNCRYCGVRQLCTDYWTTEAQRQVSDIHRFTDAEVAIVSRHGPTSWDAVVQVSPALPSGKLVLVRTRGDIELHVGDNVRILDASVTVEGDDEAQPGVITLGAQSETYAVA
jgi:hypothetical protein